MRRRLEDAGTRQDARRPGLGHIVRLVPGHPDRRRRCGGDLDGPSPSHRDVGAVEHLTLASREVKAEAQGAGKNLRRLWPWLVLAAIGVIMLEWFVYNRKVHI